MAVLCVESRPFLRIDLCLPQNGELNTEIRADFIQAVDYFKEIMTSLERKEDFTEEDINLLQDKINLFADLWLGLHGDEGMANYTHYLVSGHVTYFLRKYRNLYKYSQQGWEYLNWRLKNYYFMDELFIPYTRSCHEDSLGIVVWGISSSWMVR